LGRAQVGVNEGLIRGASSFVEKRRREIKQRTRTRISGPQGEQISELLTRVELVPLDQIHDDPRFQNVRLWASNESIDQLAESMRRDGLKQPVVVIESEDGFSTRAGFRRVKAARKLGWRRVPAVILPSDIPEADEHWVNIIENSARENLTTYEVAFSAKKMRDTFRISPKEFSMRAGYSETYVTNLLRCADNLPHEILEVWKSAAPIPIDMYVKWSSLTHAEAIREMLTYTGRHPKVVQEWRPPPQIRDRRRETHPVKMASATGLSRMQRLRFASEAASSLTDAERKLCVAVIDYCSGARDDVPGVYEPEKKKRKKDDEPQPLEILHN